MTLYTKLLCMKISHRDATLVGERKICVARLRFIRFPLERLVFDVAALRRSCRVHETGALA